MAAALLQQNTGTRAVVARTAAMRMAFRPEYLQPVPAARREDAMTAKLDRIGSIQSVAAGKMVLQEQETADYVYKVISGTLRAVRLLPDGRRYITSFLLPGDFFGFTANGHYSQTIEAVADAKLVRYSRRGFNAVLEADAHAGQHFFGLMCAELSAAQDRMLLLGRKSAMERMATFLLAMGERQSNASKDRRDVHLPMSRSDIADYLGLTVETVSRILTQLKNRRVIDLPNVNHVLFKDRDGLEEISAGEMLETA